MPRIPTSELMNHDFRETYFFLPFLKVHFFSSFFLHPVFFIDCLHPAFFIIFSSPKSTYNFSQISDGYCAFVDPGLTDEENKEECFELTEAMNWTSTFGEDDYMANIEWKHEDDGSSSKWIWDDITFMVISEVEGNWQISWWLLG